MVQQLKLLISEKGEQIVSVIRDIETDPSNLYKSVEEFRILANEALTKLIEKIENNDMGNYNEEDTSSDNGEEEVCLNAKRRKKKKMNS